MKVAILGASAQSTPDLFRCLGQAAELMTFALYGRSHARLQAVTRAVRAITQPAEIALSIHGPEQLDSALEGAIAIIVQLRIGGSPGRIFDETFPHRFNMCGDEGLGPGGLSAAWRTWPEMRLLLNRIRERSPHAVVLMLSSPVSLLTRLALDEFPELQVFGVCELPWTTIREICQQHHCDPASRLDFGYCGVNHLGWLYDICCDGRPIAGVFPLKYLVLHNQPEKVLAEQRSSRPRGEVLAGLSTRAFAVYASGTREEILETIKARPAPWYEHCISPILCSLAGQSATVPFFLTSRNRGANPAFLPQDVVEMPHSRVRGEFVPRTASVSAPPWIVDEVKRFVTYETLAAEAVQTASHRRVRDALFVHPWVHNRAVSDGLAESIINQS